MESSVRLIESRSVTAPTVIAPSALAGDPTLCLPSLPIAITQTTPFSVALFTSLA